MPRLQFVCDTRSRSFPSLSAFFFVLRLLARNHSFILHNFVKLCLILSFGSHPISRSRKRSCQACTSLKVKCDLRQPCSKCRARGRECFYATEEGQGEGSPGSSSHHQFPGTGFSGPIVNLDASAGFDPSSLGQGASADFAAAFPELSLIEETSNAFSQPLSEANLASFMAGAPRIPQSAMSLPTIDVDSNITASSIRPAPNYAFSAFGASDVAGHSRALQGFSPTMFEPFFQDIFSVEEETSHQSDQCPAPLLQAPDLENLVNDLDQANSSQSFSDGVPGPNVNLDRSLMLDLMSNTYSDNTQAPLTTQGSPPATLPDPSPLPVPLSASVPQSHPTGASYLTYDTSQTPLYTNQQVERFLPPPRRIEDGPAEPTTEELQQYRGSSSRESSARLSLRDVFCSLYFLDRVSSPDPSSPHTNTTF